MEFDAVLEWLEQKVREYDGGSLSDVEKALLEGIWQGQSYKDIAKVYGCTPEYLSQDASYEFRKKLGSIFNRKIDKRKAKFIIEELFNAANSSDGSDGPILDEDDELDFIGRTNDFSALDRLRKSKKAVLIWGAGGIGKTELANRYLKSRFSDRIIGFHLTRYRDAANSIEHEIQAKIKQKFGEEPGYSFKESLEKFKSKIEEEEWGIWIDNLEPLLDGQGKFLDQYSEYKIFIEQVACNPLSKSFCIITSREMLCEGLNLELYKLKPISIKSWSKYFEIPRDSISLSNALDDVSLSDALSEIYNYFGGNALAMKNIRVSSLEYKKTGLIGYWQHYPYRDSSDARDNVKDLIAYQFDSLSKKNADAYNLLCRMGCFRYQEVPTIPRQALVQLLWDVNESRQSGIIDELNSTGLIDREEGEFLLHPYIHQEAKTRLISNPEYWREANLVASSFWTSWVKEIVSVEDANKALESYYHCLNIKEYERAGEIIEFTRSNPWSELETLGVALYRLGLSPNNISLIKSILPEVGDPSLLSKLLNTIGDSFWITGNLKNAIKEHKRSRFYAKTILGNIDGEDQNDLEAAVALRMLTVSFINIGLCYTDLFEIEMATYAFKKAICDMKDIYSDERFINRRDDRSFSLYLKDLFSSRENPTCSTFLAYLESCNGNRAESLVFLDKALDSLKADDFFATTWGKGYIPTYLGITYYNLGFPKEAKEKYDEAIKYSKSSQFKQVEAKALTGIAAIYRDERKYSQAIDCLNEAILLCDDISAKCDLAEAYLQLGSTYQAMGECIEANDAFDKAQTIWQAVGAPKQLERLARIR